jgi:ubiquinone/menaquinone biosynthesis C-methylase UbiE
MNFDRAAGFYDATRGFSPGEEAAVAATIARAGDFNPSQQILEVGIGTGRIALMVAPYVGAYFGLDLSQKMLAVLREKQNDETIYPVQGDAGRLPYPSDHFDVIILAHILHLVPDLDAVGAELRRVLKPDGCILYTWHTDDDTFKPLYKVWSQHIPPRDNWRRASTYLEDTGWQQVGEVFTHSYTTHRSPQEFYNRFNERCWSSTWNLSDTDHKIAIDAIGQAIRTTYTDPSQPIAVNNAFKVKRLELNHT